MLAFIVLAVYGFFLIYALTSDVGRLARSMEIVVIAMNDMSANMTAVAGNVGYISGNLSQIAAEAGHGTDSMQDMLMKMDKVNTSMGLIALPMYRIRNDTGCMSQNLHDVSGPVHTVSGLVPR